ncbi:hypothetical protein [Streptococcus parasuis]|uniref:hypothetical protein n=1 Tax=Streptococcus parasuis TaxID=1501662 RepID=UPI002FDA4527
MNFTALEQSTKLSETMQEVLLFILKKIVYSISETSIMKLAILLYSKKIVSLSLSKSVISFDNRLEAVRLSGKG